MAVMLRRWNDDKMAALAGKVDGFERDLLRSALSQQPASGVGVGSPLHST